MALWHRLPAAPSRPARGIAYEPTEADWNPPAGASRDPQGLRERPACVVGGPFSSTVGSGDVFGGLRGRSVDVASSRRRSWTFLGDAGAADRPGVAFGLQSSPADVSSEASIFRWSVQATCLAVCGGARWTWRRQVRDHGLFSATRALQTAWASRSASGAPRPMSALFGFAGASRQVLALGGLRRCPGCAVA